MSSYPLFTFFSNKTNIDEFKKSDLCKRILDSCNKTNNFTVTANMICSSEYRGALHNSFVTNAYRPYINFLTKEFVDAKIIEFVEYNKHAFDEYVNHRSTHTYIETNNLPNGYLWMFRRFIHIFESPYCMKNEMDVLAVIIKDAVKSCPSISHIFMLIIPEYAELCKNYLLRKSSVLTIHEEMCNGFEQHPFADDYIVYNIVRYLPV